MKRYLALVLIGLALCTLGVSTPAYAANTAVQISSPLSNPPLHDAFYAPHPPESRRLAADTSAASNTAPGTTTSASIAAAAAAIAPTYYQTSEFMLGKVAVGLVLPQCNGAIDKCSETWNQTTITQVLSQVSSAMTWWSNRMNGQMSFVFDLRAQAPTGYEPIQHSQSDESLWIGDTMTHMGFSGSGYFEQVYAYDNWMRQKYSADWAFTLFVADSANNPTGAFSNGYYAYTYVSGPFSVITYGNANYGSENMAAVVAHETAHIFGALDEYPGAGVPCTETGGYLVVQNQNSDMNCASNVPSIMRGGTAPYFNNQVDSFALAMLGNRVSSGPLPDPINTKPVVLLDPITANNANPTITGTAQDQPFKAVGGNALTINFISNVKYRVDGGAWQNAAPFGGDASFNQVAEGFTFAPALSNGTHSIEVQAVNRVNHASDIVSASVTVQGASPQPTTVPATPTQQPPVPTATALPPVPTATTQPPAPTATKQPPAPTATMQPPAPTATKQPPVPTATTQPPAPTATLKPTVAAPTVAPTAVAPGGAITIQLNAGKTAVSLPISGYMASSLIAAINAQGGSATEVDRWTGKDWNMYKANGSGDFNVDAGTGYIVKANAPSNWLVPLNGGSGLSKIKLDRGWTMLGVPACKDGSVSCYTASTLAAQINAHGGGVAEIDRMVNGNWSPYLVGYWSNTNFPIVVGQGYFVRSTKAVDWTP